MSILSRGYAVHEKYNTIMPETDEKTLCVEVDKPISGEGYRDNFLPRLKNMVEKTGEARILIYFKKYEGWEEQAANFDMQTTVEYGKFVKKLAFVNPPEKLVFKNKIKEPLFKGETQFFTETDLPKALSWVKS